MPQCTHCLSTVEKRLVKLPGTMTPSRTVLVMLFFVVGAILYVQAMPQGYNPPKYAAKGRVKIQAYRGPNKEKIGYDYFAPWGFYVTQPEDDKAHYH